MLTLTGHAQTLYTTTGDLQQKLQQKKLKASRSKSNALELVLNPAQKFQTIIGIGGTFSEASAYNLKRISESKREEVLRALFDSRTGAGWTVLRTTINSCDASSQYYSYDETPDDTLLMQFNIQPDIDNGVIPTLKEIQTISDRSLKLLASPWTPPVWMKDSKEFNHGSLLKKYYPTWALYFSKYLQAYQRNGMKIWGITPQNEPAAYQQAWDACGWLPEQMAEFIGQHLGPQLEKDGLAGTQIFSWDHNKNQLEKWADTLLSSEAKKYVAGFAHHWYEDGEGKYYEPLEKVHTKYPNMPLLADEQGVFGLYLMDKTPAELYALDLIENLNHHSAAWFVWGMCFDHTGGPNHARNFNHSPIMIDVAKEKIYYNPSYYYIAHASKFVQPGAVRIGFDNKNQNLKITAIQNPNGEMVVLLLNNTNQMETVTVNKNSRVVSISVQAHSMNTLVW